MGLGDNGDDPRRATRWPRTEGEKRMKISAHPFSAPQNKTNVPYKPPFSLLYIVYNTKNSYYTGCFAKPLVRVSFATSCSYVCH